MEYNDANRANLQKQKFVGNNNNREIYKNNQITQNTKYKINNK